jgi:SAM-dependent methyltransferase
MHPAMSATPHPGTQGYAEDAERLIPRYDAIAFADKYRPVLHLLPLKPARILDIGAGTGADAAWLATQGHEVLAVEPTQRFREAGQARHPSPRIEWLADSLPGLHATAARGMPFDLVLASAVWMHLDAGERQQALPRVAALMKPHGLFILSLRHGPAPANRRMFEVTAEETIRLARQHGLAIAFRIRTASVQAANRDAGIAWSWLAFRGSARGSRGMPDPASHRPSTR